MARALSKTIPTRRDLFFSVGASKRADAAFSQHAGNAKPYDIAVADAWHAFMLEIPLSHAKDVWRKLVYRSQAGNRFACVVGYLVDGRPNAECSQNEEFVCASVNTGLAYQLFCLAHAVMEISHVFPEIPDPRAKIQRFKVRTILAGDSAYISRCCERLWRVLPQDLRAASERVRTAHLLYFTMMNIVWRHEIFHGVLGHLHFLRAQFGLSRYAETGLHWTGGESALMEPLEYQADLAAMASIALELADNVDPVSPALLLEPSDDTKLLLLYVAASLVWALWDSLERKSDDEVRSHPLPGTRFMTLHRAIRDAYAVRSGVNEHRDGLKRISGEMARLARADNVFQSFANVGTPGWAAAAGQDVLRLDRQCADLRDRLKPYLFELRDHRSPRASNKVPHK